MSSLAEGDVFLPRQGLPGLNTFVESCEVWDNTEAR